jgi:putative ABC transport system ATP-binding protein/lipoprotein-releasing system ATP-binding protein
MSNQQEILARCLGAGRTYGAGAAVTVALQATDCEVREGARLAIVGPSGSGKSTLLHLLAGLDDPSVGEVDWPALGPRHTLRPGPIAVVFQGPSLLAPLTIRENVALPLVLAGIPHGAAQERATAALELVGLLDIAEKLPEEVSGGQAQRTAIARALPGEPRMVLADEPTGQLDRQTADHVLDVLITAVDHAGAALVVSTHDPAIADRLPDRWDMQNGSLRKRSEARAAPFRRSSGSAGFTAHR